MKRLFRIISVFLALPAAHAAEADPAVYTRSMSRVESLDPARAASLYASRAIRLVYEAPLEYDYAARPYVLRPSLAETLPAVSADGLDYTVTLRADARFAPDPCFGPGPGRPVTAADLAYSLKRLADRKIASPGAWIVERTVLGMEAFAARSAGPGPTDYAAEVPGLAVTGPRTLRIRLAKPLYVFPYYLAMTYAAAVPREAVERYGLGFAEHPVGSGPYRLAAWRRNHEMTFERVPEWPGWRTLPGPRFGVIRYRVIDDVSTQWLCFLAGELDFLGEIARDNWDAVIGPSGALSPALVQRGATLHAVPSLEIAYLGINMDDPVLGRNKALRQALNAAFDSSAWTAFYNRRVIPANGPVPAGVAGALATPAPHAFDLGKARALLAEAGYPGGTDPATGRRLTLTLDLGQATQDHRETAELLASFYARVGIRLVPQFYNWSAFLKRISERQSQLYRIGWVGDYSDPENFLMLFYGPNASPGPNRSNYSNPAFDRLYEAALREADPARRAVLWARAQEIIREDCPWVFLHYPLTYSLCGPRVQGYIPSAFPDGQEKNLRPAPGRERE